MVYGTVEKTLDAMLNAEADQLYGAGCYKRSEARQATRGRPQIRVDEVSPTILRLRREIFETALLSAISPVGELGRSPRIIHDGLFVTI
jgi:putative transposase